MCGEVAWLFAVYAGASMGKETWQISFSLVAAMSLMFFGLFCWEGQSIVRLFFDASSTERITSSFVFWFVGAIFSVLGGLMFSIFTRKDP
jgi:hypothetical protein